MMSSTSTSNSDVLILVVVCDADDVVATGVVVVGSTVVVAVDVEAEDAVDVDVVSDGSLAAQAHATVTNRIPTMKLRVTANLHPDHLTACSPCTCPETAMAALIGTYAPRVDRTCCQLWAGDTFGSQGANVCRYGLLVFTLR
jgi:hypothetical protein